MNTTEDGLEPVGEGPIDTLDMIEQARHMGMLAGADYAKAMLREVFRANIGTVVEVLDAHDPIHDLDDFSREVRICPGVCGFIGNPTDWERHVADKLADTLAGGR